MSRLRQFARLAVTSAILLAGLTHVARAQGHRDRHVVNGGRVAGIAPAPVPVVIVAPAPFYGGYAYGYGPSGYFPAAGFVQNFPVVMLQDGRVFANFGFGFEHVLHSCSPNALSTTVNGVPVIASTIGQPLPVQPQAFQPSPVQATASEQQLVRALYPAAVVAVVPGPFAASFVTPSCWSNNSGSVFVFHR